MKRLVPFALLTCLTLTCALSAHARQPDRNSQQMRAYRKASKKAQKDMRKYAKRQQKAMKRSAKAQRKALKRAQQHSTRY